MILMPSILWSLGVVAIAVLLLANDPYSMALDNLVLLVIAGALLYLGFEVLQWWLDHFIVTNRRVLLVSGVLTRTAAIMPLIKVTDMTYEQNPLARLLGYGTFVFESAGQDQALSRVTHLPGGPRQLYVKISSLLFATYSEPTAPPLPAWVEEQLTANVRTGRPPDVEEPRIHQTTPIPRPDDVQGPHAAGRQGDN